MGSGDGEVEPRGRHAGAPEPGRRAAARRASSRRSPSDPPTRAAGEQRPRSAGSARSRRQRCAASTSAVALAAGPLTSSSRWIAGSPTRKKWKVAAVDPDRHPQRDEPARRADPADPSQPCPHPVRRPRRPRRVLLPWNSSRTASPPHFTRLAAIARTRPASRSAKVAFRMSLMLLGADLALARESLGELGEARDVDERERAVHLAPQSGGLLAQPGRRQVRHVRIQHRAAVHGPPQPP